MYKLSSEIDRQNLRRKFSEILETAKEYKRVYKDIRSEYE
jgi:hypothetical protein